VVIRDNKGLLIQRGINPNRGAWQIPGGYVEADEEIVDAVEREVLEEAGVVAKVQDVVGVRHSLAGSIGGPSANIYVVFRLTPISGEPTFDGDETIGAGYFSLEEIAQMDRVQGLSTWAIRRALELPPTEGFAVDRSDDNLTRPGWSLFAPKS
jgi:ADP-ribose pyrophosphatase YjhB (NUDIX family)